MTSSLFVDIAAGMNGTPRLAAGALIPVEGTVYPDAPNPPSFITDDGNGFYCGFASAVAGGVANRQDGLFSCPTNPVNFGPNRCGAGYEALTVPMWPSVQQGRGSVGLAGGGAATKYYKANGSYDGLVLTFAAWSQGVMALLQWFFNDVVPDNAPFHYLLPYIYRLYCFGDPFRCPNVAHGNEIAGTPQPGKLDGQVTGGIAGPLDYTPAQANMLAPDGKFLIYSFAKPNDLYAYAPCGENPWKSQPSVGNVEYLFFKIIMQPNFTDIIELAELLDKPIGDVEALINTGEFFGAGNNAGHYTYWVELAAAIDDLLTLGNSLPLRAGY